MAQKRVNKNLVAGLTIAGILLSVAAVYVVVQQFSPRDPEAFARSAEQREKAGDYKGAIAFYGKAFEISQNERGQKNVKYLVEAARCWYRLGEISSAIQTLYLAHAQEPGDKAVIEAYLGHMWELKRHDALYPNFMPNVRDFAARLLAIEPENVTGLASQALALSSLSEERGRDLKASDAALEKAAQLAPGDPRVVLLQVDRARQRGQAKVAAGSDSEADLEQINREYREAEYNLLAAGVEKNPTNVQLLERFIGAILIRDRNNRAEPERLLKQAEAAEPQNADLHLLHARVLLDALARKRGGELSDEEFRRQIDEARMHAARASELDPALYDAYILEVQAMLAERGPNGFADSSDPQRWEAALARYQKALDDTVTIKSVRHEISEQRIPSGRLLLLTNALRAALAYASMFKDEERKARLTWARKFLDQAETLAPNSELTHFMRGQYFVAEGDLTSAAKAFVDAHSKNARLELWMLTFGQLPAERLAELFHDLRQYGEARKYNDLALKTYEDATKQMNQFVQGVPIGQVVLRAALLTVLDDPQAALDFVNQQLPRYKNDRRLLMAKADALRALNRGKEAVELLQGMGQEDPGVRLSQARLLALEGKPAEAEPMLREIISANPDDLRAISLWRDVMMQLGRQAQAREFLRGLSAKVTSEQTRRVLAAYDAVLSGATPEERDAALLKLIQENPDPKERLRELYSFHRSRGKLDEAARQLQEAEKLDPADLEIAELQFYEALRRQDADAAERYVPRLVAANADKAEGALFRGDVAVARNNVEEALRQYELAERKLPPNAPIKLRKARAYIVDKQYPAAIAAAEEALVLNPRDFSAHKILFTLYNDQGDRAKAAIHLERGLALNPNDPELLANNELLTEEKDPLAAIEKREKKRAESPKDVENLVRLAELHERAALRHTAQNQPDAAKKAQDNAEAVILAASEIEPANGKVARFASRFFGVTGRREAAERVLGAFLTAQTGPGKVLAHAMLAACYEALGDNAAAEASYRAARDAVAEHVSNADDAGVMRAQAGFDLLRFQARLNDFTGAADTARAILAKLDAKAPRQAPFIKTARKALIDALLQGGQIPDAESELASYLKDYPADFGGRVAQAQLALLKGDRAAQLAALDEVLKIDPGHVWALYTRGSALLETGKYLRAKDDLMRCRDLLMSRPKESPERPLAALAIQKLVTYYEMTKQIQEAETELRLLITALEEARATEGELQMAGDRLVQLLLQSNQHEKAHQVITEFMSKYPNMPYWPFQMARMLSEREQFAAAVTFLETAMRLAERISPEGSAAIFADYLFALARAGRAAEAAQRFANYKVQPIPAGVRVAAAFAMTQLGRRDEALDQIRQALLSAAAMDLRELAVVARAVEEVMPPEEARRFIESVSSQTPLESADGRMLRLFVAWQTIRQGKPADALPMIDAVIAAAAADGPERLEAMLLRGEALQATQRDKESITTYEQVLALQPNNVRALNNLSYLLATRADRPQEALKYAQKAVALQPQGSPSSDVLDTFGVAAARNNMLDEAESALRQAIALSPKHAAAWCHLGQVLIQRGQGVEGRENLRRSVELAKESGDQQVLADAEQALKGVQ